MLFPALKNERPRARKCQFTLSRPVTFFPPGNFSSCHSRGGQKSENFRARFFRSKIAVSKATKVFQASRANSRSECSALRLFFSLSWTCLMMINELNENCGEKSVGETERLELSRERYGWGKKAICGRPG